MPHAKQHTYEVRDTVLNQCTCDRPSLDANMTEKGATIADSTVLRRPLTDKQREVVRCVMRSPRPSMHAIAAHLGVSYSAVQQRMAGAARKGAVRTSGNGGCCVDVLVPEAAFWPAVLETSSGERLGMVALFVTPRRPSQ